MDGILDTPCRNEILSFIKKKFVNPPIDVINLTNAPEFSNLNYSEMVGEIDKRRTIVILRNKTFDWMQQAQTFRSTNVSAVQRQLSWTNIK